jgi:hypothetical protein
MRVDKKCNTLSVWQYVGKNQWQREPRLKHYDNARSFKINLGLGRGGFNWLRAGTSGGIF